MKTWKFNLLFAGLMLTALVLPGTGATNKILAGTITPGGTLVYNIQNGTSLPGFFVGPQYMDLGPVRLEQGGQIKVTINSTFTIGSDPEVGLSINVTDKEGNVNWTAQNVTNADAANNLILGLWPNNLGFVTQINWTDWNITLFNNLSTQLTKFSNSNGLVTIVINATCRHQNTTLVYDASTGILKSVFTGIYFLNLCY